MKLCRIVFALGLVGAIGGSGLAQTSARVVKVRPSEPVFKVKTGAAVEAAVVIDIDAGYHINSNRPAESFLIATALKLQPLKGLAYGRVFYPKAKLQKFSFSPTPMSVYEGKVLLKFTVRALPSLAAGSHVVAGKLTVQACDHEKCLRPQTIDVEIPFDVSK
ncbi:MAG TPA: protein-disulfide reductase DsbD domain-containing protein [Blastocatellia bacterium]|nr:protein-disulfide reductase DsbD domain-containing protein [Blastocatellia bacterium]